MASVLDDIKRTYATGSITIKFILINIGVFLLVNIFLLMGFFTQTSTIFVIKWLAASSSAMEMLYRPWTLITYMFLHEGFWHLFWNMIMLYFGGRIYADMLGDRRFISTYILGGISGFLLFMIAFNVFPVFSGNPGMPILGASAAVLALLVGIATYLPDYRVHLPFIGPVALKYIAMILVLIDLIQIRSSANSGGHIAHLGGALYGFISSRQLAKGLDFSDYFFAIVDSFTGLFKRSPKMKVVKGKKAPSGKRPPTGKERDIQEKVDEILDKISRSGYDSLTKEEKEFLFNASKK